MKNSLSFFIKYAKFRYRLYRVILRLKMGKKKRDDHLNENETFVDVGANVGKYSLSIANDYKDKSVKIIAIEAQPQNYKALCRNIKLNKNFRKNITTINRAVADYKGKVTLYESLEYGYRTRFETSTIINNGISENNNRNTSLVVECDTLDNILAAVTK